MIDVVTQNLSYDTSNKSDSVCVLFTMNGYMSLWQKLYKSEKSWIFIYSYIYLHIFWDIFIVQISLVFESPRFIYIRYNKSAQDRQMTLNYPGYLRYQCLSDQSLTVLYMCSCSYKQENKWFYRYIIHLVCNDTASSYLYFRVTI